MILTTHYMDEAEALGDRIGIMSKGQLKVCGSALFLKNRYGLGTLLEISLAEKTNLDMSNLLEFLQSYQNQAEQQIVDKELQLEQDGKIKGKLDESNLYVIKLPQSLKPFYQEIFQKLDQEETQKKFNIETYNVRVTSLEEVFNALGEEELANKSDDNLGANLFDEEDTNLDSKPMPVKSLSHFQYFKIVLSNRMKIFFRNGTFINDLLVPIGFFTFLFYMIPSSSISDPRLIELSMPSSQFNSSNVGAYNVGLPMTQFAMDQLQLNEKLTVQMLEDNICNQNYVNCVSIMNTQDADAQTMASEFSREAFEFSQQNEEPIQGLVFIGEQSGTFADQSYQLSLNIMTNLSAPISMPMIAAQGLKSIAKHYTQGQQYETDIVFDFIPLVASPTVATSQQPDAPLAALGFGSILQFFFLKFVFNDFSRLVVMREKRILRQYVLVGAPIGAFLLTNALLAMLTVLLTTAVMSGIYSATILDYDGAYVVMLIASVAIPIQVTYQFVTSRPSPAIAAIGAYIGITSLLWFPMTFVILIIAFNEQWMVAIVLECLFSTNATWAAGWLWIKFLFSYTWWLWEPEFNPTPGLQWWSFNRSLPMMIGMTVGMLFQTCMIIKVLKKGMSQRANDGTVSMIQSKRKKYPTISDADLNPESTEFMVDDLVKQEQERVVDIIDKKMPTETLTVSNLKKFYIVKNNNQKKVEQSDMLAEDDDKAKSNIVKAVQGISFSLNKGECFILLGVNGAGKSTTFKCLATDELLTQGAIQIGGLNIDQYQGSSQKMAGIIGYCPQVSPIDKEMTVKEKLIMLGQLQGLQTDLAFQYAKLIAKKFEIYQFFNTYADKLSGGNQRKFMTAIAMYSSPELVMLDEASAGVDPYSRRRLWKTIRNQGEKSALVVTTHSMEEAEALGTKMAIQVDGKFKCFGTAQQIKQRYGQGFTVTFKLDVKKLDERVEIFSNRHIESRDSITVVQEGKLTDSVIDSENGMIGSQSAEMNYMSIDQVKQRIVQWFMSESKTESESHVIDSFIAEQFRNELGPNGMLSAQYNLIQKGKPINLQVLFKQILLLSQINYIVAALSEEFGDTQLIDFTGNQLQLKVANNQFHSIGFMFAFIERMKGNTQKFVINEYQAQETTLEQVFNQFAKERGFTKLNKSIRRQTKLIK